MYNPNLPLRHFESPGRDLVMIQNQQNLFPGKNSLSNNPEKSSPALSFYNDHLNRAGLGFWKFSFNDNMIRLCPVSCLMTQLKSAGRLNTLVRKFQNHNLRSFLREINALAATGNGFEQELQLVAENGESKWFKLAGILEQGMDGDGAITGTLLDITEFKLEELKKTDLMHFLCHELKSPLSTLRLYIQLMGKNVKHLAPHLAAPYIGKADEQVTVMNSLVDQYLNLSTSAQPNEGPTGCFDISELVRCTVSRFAEVNTDHVFKMELCGALFFTGNKGKIAQVMDNLIGNAVKFSPRHSFIKVCIRKTAKHIEFSVLDQGIGIEVSDQQKLFTRHFRAAHSRTGTIKGHGLGLYLSKGIINEHQGNVFVKSEPGRGSVFGFTLPLNLSN